MANHENVIYERVEDKIYRLTLNRPEKDYALSQRSIRARTSPSPTTGSACAVRASGGSRRCRRSLLMLHKAAVNRYLDIIGIRAAEQAKMVTGRSLPRCRNAPCGQASRAVADSVQKF